MRNPVYSSHHAAPLLLMAAISLVLATASALYAPRCPLAAFRRAPRAEMVANPPPLDEEKESPLTGAPGKVDIEPARKGLAETLQALQVLRPRRRDASDESNVADATESSDSKPTSRLIVVSNRLPFSVKPGDAGYQFVMSSGGLVSAMLGVMEDDAMTWLGWPGISAEGEEDQAAIRAQLAEHKCVPVFLDEYIADTYYNGFCNSVLWPLFHYVQDVLDTNPLQEQWEAYQAANKMFFDEIMAMDLKPGDTVWVHDYHLMLLPTMLKSAMPSLRVGWFLHTPFPTSEVFRMLPMRDDIMTGLVGADLLGFHTNQYVRHFLSAARRTLGASECATSLSASAISCRIPRAGEPDPEARAGEALDLRIGLEAGAAATEQQQQQQQQQRQQQVMDVATGGSTPAAEEDESAAAFASAADAIAKDAAEEAPSAAMAGAAEADADDDDDDGAFAHTAHVAAFPIGISPERFLEELGKGETQQAIKKLQEKFGNRKMLLGIDRLDPIKGIPHKLLAFERLLEDHPEHADEVVLVQIAVPSRLDVPLHQQLQTRLHNLVGRINGRFGSLGQVPIHYLDTTVNFHELVALYAASSAMVISSLRDGMNLVSFEWTVCQQHKPRPWNSGDPGFQEGVLVLSEFAGAADHLDDGALMVNPYDTQSLADALHDAITMPLERRQALHKNAYEHVTTKTATAWAEKFASTLSQLHTGSTGLLPDASSNMAGLLAMLEQQPRIALFTDYDGTLTPIVPDPSSALLSAEAKAQLTKLATLMPSAIVSGRSRDKIDDFVGVPSMWVAGAHGLDIAGPEGSGVAYQPAATFRDALVAAAADLRVAVAALPGAEVEDNEYAVSVHYRHVADADMPALDAAVEAALAGQPSLQRFPGKMVVELRPALSWNKGSAVTYILDHLEAESGGAPIFPIYLGDDVSDEDAFAALRARGGLAILVSEEMRARDETAAQYRLSSPRAVLKLLKSLTRIAAMGEAASSSPSAASKKA